MLRKTQTRGKKREKKKEISAEGGFSGGREDVRVGDIQTREGNKARWLGDSPAHLAGENHLQVWLLWLSGIFSFFMFGITDS